MAKLTPSLEHRLRRAAPGDFVEIVIEVAHVPQERAATAGAERHAAFARDFSLSTKALTDVIDSVGGQVLGSSWLSGAVKARVPAGSIERLRAVDNVESIDVPHQLTRG